MSSVLTSFQLTPDSGTPDYLQIARKLEEAIRTGAIAEGERLPPTTELVDLWRVNITRLQRAMNILVRQGLLQRHPGRGTFVTSHLIPPLVGILVGPDMELEASHFHRVTVGRLRRVIQAAGLKVRVYESDGDKARRDWDDLQFDLRQHRFNGLIFVSASQLRTEYAEERLPFSKSVPTVSFGAWDSQPDLCIDVNDFYEKSITWLHGEGCRKLAWVHLSYLLPDSPIHQMRQAQIGLDDHAVIQLIPPTGQGESERSFVPDRLAYQMMMERIPQWRKRRFLPDGIIVGDDMMARGVATAIREAWRPGTPLPKMIVLGSRELPHFYAIPMARYQVSIAKIARRLYHRLEVRAAAMNETLPMEPIRGEIVAPFQ